jgi:iron(III) transport system substrate-binding protein
MPLNRRVIGAGLLGFAASSVAIPAVGSAPPGAAARRVRVLSTTDRHTVQPLIDDFERRHPGLQVEYVELGSLALYERFVQQREGAPERADVLWSSAMDLQIKLVNDGYALRYETPHAPQLPKWAIWKHEAYGITYEPVGMVVNRELLAADEIPHTRVALASLLQATTPRWRGRTATYDIVRAGLGFLIAAHDAMTSPRYWELVRALGRCETSLHVDTQSMLERVAAGDALLAYNVLGSYAEVFARTRPEIGVVYFDDYTLVVSRVAFISRTAPNSHGARLWLDYLLSAPGQRLLTMAGGLHAVRTDAVQAHAAAAAPHARQGHAFRPIALGPGLLAHLDRSKHDALLKRWRREFDLQR